MSTSSGCDDIVRLCQFIRTEDCQSIFFRWLNQGPQWKISAVVDYMRNNLPEGMSNCIPLNAMAVYSSCSAEQLLNIVSKKKGKILSTFLLALRETCKRSYWPLEQELKTAVDGYSCEVAINSSDLPRATRKTLIENMSEEERLLLLCSKCDDLMEDPVLLSCLHSTCRKCVSTLCPQRGCGREVKESSHKTNLFVLHRIATAVKSQSLLGKFHSDSSEPGGLWSYCGGISQSTFECAVHHCQLEWWCRDECKGFCCYSHVTVICGKNHHRYEKIGEIANKMRKWIDTFLDHGVSADVIDSEDNLNVVKPRFNQENLIQKCEDVLKRQRQLLSDKTDLAFNRAKETVKMHCQNLDEEVKGVCKQLAHARLYANFILDNTFCIVDQRELLYQQLRLLLLQIGKDGVCRDLPHCDDLCMLAPAEPPSGKRRRLFIDCLEYTDYSDYYMRVTQALVGMPQLIETDVPAQPIWHQDHAVKRGKEDLSFVIDSDLREKTLPCNLEEAKKPLHENQEALQSLNKKMELCDKQKLLDDFDKKTGKLWELESVGSLIENMRKTSEYVSSHITAGELDNVISGLRSKCSIVEGDLELIKAQGSCTQRATYLINDIIIRSNHGIRVRRFLQLLGAQREDLLNAMQSGIVP